MIIRPGIGIFAAVLAMPSVASADDRGWYVAVDYGKTHYSDNAKFDVSIYRVTTQTSPITFDDDSHGHRIVGGYRFNSYWGLEAGYVDLGHATAYLSGVSAPLGTSCGPSCENSYNFDPELEARGWTSEVTGRLPLGHGWALDGRIGLMRWRMDLDSDVTPTNSPPYGNTSVPANTRFSGTGTSTTYGYGVSWAFSQHWTARLSWDKYQNMYFGTNSSGYTYDVPLRSLGLEYHF